MAPSNRLTISSISLHLLLLILFTKTHLSKSTILDPNPLTDIHDLLPQYGFPKGIIPNNIKSYTLSDDGSFVVEFGSPCYVHFDQLVYYDRKIKGRLSYGKVSDVSGIQAKQLFLWVTVTGMQLDADSDSIEFFVGALSKKLPANQFEEIPACMNKARPHFLARAQSA